METDRLKYFCTIAETGSLTAASAILNVSHSGLSKAMSVLQTELNTQLFRPLGRGLELTAAGKEAYLKSKDVLESLEKLKSFPAAAAQKHIRIGLAEIFSLSLSGELSKSLPTADFYEIDSGEAEVRLLEESLDFAISFIPFPHNDLEYLKIKTVKMGVFHCNPAFDKMKLSEIPFVVPNAEIKNNPLSIRSRDGWPSELARNGCFGASSLALALSIVRAGSAAVFMPCFLQEEGMREFETKKSAFAESERAIFIVKKKNAEETQVMKQVAKAIRQNC